METIKQEALKQCAFMDDSSSAPRAWEDAELKLQALGGPRIFQTLLLVIR